MTCGFKVRICSRRSYFVGPKAYPSVPQLATWIKDNLQNVGRCIIVQNDGSTRCKALSQSLCSQVNGRFDAQVPCPK
jgi:hypothetical protein